MAAEVRKRPSALLRAYRDVLRLHEERRPPFDPFVDTLEAVDRYEQEWDIWNTEWLRLRQNLKEVETRGR